jgi:O-antigen/teichoic acid export membrane protein
VGGQILRRALPGFAWPGAVSAALRRGRSRRLLGGGTLILAATFVWHLSNFAFNSITGRVLGPAGYGTVAAVIAVLYVASPLFMSVQTVASKISTGLAARGEHPRIRALAAFYSWRLGLGALVVAAALALASSALARFLRLPSGVPLAMVGGAFAFSVVSHLQRGVFQGTTRFGRFATSTIIEATVKLAALVLALTVLWRSEESAVLAVVVGSAVAVAAGSLLLRYLPSPRGQVELIAHPYRYSLATLATLVLLSLLLTVDILAAKRYLPAHDAGLYAAVSLAGKIVFFATSGVTLVLFPLFSERQEQGRDARRPLLAGLGVVAACAAALSVLYAVAPQVVIDPLFGAGFEGAGPYLFPMSAAFGCYAIAYLTAMYLLSQKQTAGAGLLLVAAFCQAAALYSFHGSLGEIVTIQVAVLSALAASLVARTLLR